MKPLNKILTLVLALLSALALASCHDEPDDIYADVEMLLQAPAGERLAMVRPDNGQPSTFLLDINNRRRYQLPLFVDNSARMRVERGVYVMAFDGEATMADGQVRRVRMIGHSVMREALFINKARVIVTLKVIFL